MSDSNSRCLQTHMSSCTTEFATAGSLADLLLEAPLVMQLMDGASWSAVSACSRQLRQLVQSKTKIVYVHNPADMHLLVKYKRPQICLICLGIKNMNDVELGMPWPQNDALELQAIMILLDRPFQVQVLAVKPMLRQHEDQLACQSDQLHQWIQRRDWKMAKVTGVQQDSTGATELAQLNALGLQHIKQLDKAAITHLVTGDWCDLVSLNLSNTNMGAALLQLLAKGSWRHLECVTLSGIKLSEEALSHLCAAGWPLQRLILRGTSLTPSGVAILASTISERLCTLNLAENLTMPQYSSWHKESG